MNVESNRRDQLASTDRSPTAEDRSPTDTSKPSRRRRVTRRLLAVLLGLSPLICTEIVLRMAGWQPSAPRDPFIGFDHLEPLFVAAPGNSGVMVTNPLKTPEFFCFQSFPRAKPKGEFRIFCLGGSTVQGRPYGSETSLTAWLELSLQAGDERRDYRVVNCGGISYASYRLIPMMEEVLEYEPDLIIVCSGHNEFLEARTYEKLRNVSPVRVRLRRILRHVRAFQLAEQWFGDDEAGPAECLPGEVDALLDYRGGLAVYHRDDVWQSNVQRHYGWNLRSLAAHAKQASIPILFLLPVANLVDCPPFKSESSTDLTPEEARSFDSHWQASMEEGRSPGEQLKSIRAAVAIDPRHAGAQFRLAKAYQTLGRHAEAATCFLEARNQDICPLRMLDPMYELAEELLALESVPYLDLRTVIEAAEQGQLPGDRLMVDHVHPTVYGHQLIASKIHEKLVTIGWVGPPSADLERRRAKAFQQHLSSLGEPYFARGKAKLEGLRLWTQGRANKQRK
ncbi:MAG TPA: SGNH/GDSL hydrolase family protein [Planctomycetes bacterium]|nr:SGNH/GDSL hydrolase family protein [Planctomycetaceae bacterium]HIM29774.1 SGNH/GDSL hydrolase family protein [Planctomycetota bacterium]